MVEKTSILEYPKRILKSIAFGAVDGIKSLIPITIATIESNREAVQKLYQDTLNSKQQLKRLKNIQDTYIFKPSKEILKNIKSDLKSGKFYHPDRAAAAEEAAMSSMMADLLKDSGLDEDLGDMLTGEQEMTESDLNDMPVTPVREITTGEAIVAGTVAREQRMATNSLINVQQQIAEAQLQTSRTLGNLTIKQLEKQTDLLDQGFSLVAQGFNTIIEYNNEALTQHIKNSTTYYSNMTQLTQENNAILKELIEMKRNTYKKQVEEGEMSDPTSYDLKSGLFKDGVFNLSEYSKIVGKNFEGTMLGAIPLFVAGIQAAIAGFVANPLHEATKHITTSLLGPALRLSMKRIDSSITGFLATALTRLHDWGHDPKSGMLGDLGKLFGVGSRKINLREVNIAKDIKGPRSWDGEDHFYLTKVIPSYLSNIEAGITGTDARIFNMTTGKFTTIQGLRRRDQYNEEQMVDNLTGDLQYQMRNMMYRLFKFDPNDKESIGAINKDIKEFARGFYRAGGAPRKIEDAIHDDRFGTNQNTKTILAQIYKNIMEQFPHIGNALNGRIIESLANQNRRRTKGELYDEEQVSAINADLQFRNGLAIDLNNPNRVRNSILKDEDAAHSLLDWQEKIYNVLVDIRDYGGMGGNGGGGASSIVAPVLGRLARIKNFFFGGEEKPVKLVGEIAAEDKAKRRANAEKYEEAKKQARLRELKRFAAKNEGVRPLELLVPGTDYLDPIRLAQKYYKNGGVEGLTQGEEFNVFRDRFIDPSTGEATDLYKTVISYIKNPDNVDKEGGFGQWDEGRQVQEAQDVAKQQGILKRAGSKYTYKEIAGDETIVSEMVHHAFNKKDVKDPMMEANAIWQERSFIDSIFGSDKTVEQANAKIEEMGINSKLPFFKQLAAAGSLGDKFGVISANISKLVAAPRSILVSVLHSADKMMYEFMFGTNEHQVQGRPIRGLFDKMVSKIEETFDKLNSKLNNGFLGQLSHKKDQFLDRASHFVEANFGFNPRKTWDNVWTQSKGIWHIINPFATDVKKSAKEVTGDISDAFNNTIYDLQALFGFIPPNRRRHAKGSSYIGNDLEGEFAFVSPKEAIIYPKYNPFNPNRDKMPDYGTAGTTSVEKGGLTFIPKGSAVIPSKYNPFNPDRDKANIEQDAINETRMQEKFNQKFSSYASGDSLVGQEIEPGLIKSLMAKYTNDIPIDISSALSHILHKMDYEDAFRLLSGLAYSLGATPEKIMDFLGRTTGKGLKRAGEAVELSDEEKEFFGNILEKMWKSQIVRKDEKLKTLLRNVAEGSGFDLKRLKSEKDIRYEEYNNESGILTGVKQFMSQAFGKDPVMAVEETKDYITHHVPEIAKGGMVGALAGTLFPLGGPLFGAIGGAITSLLSKNKSFMEYVFGKEVVNADGSTSRDESGLISAKFMKSLEKYLPDIKKYGITGSLLGIVMPFGPLGGLMAGVAASYIKNNQEAQRFLFGGEEDEHSGIFSRNLRGKIKKALPRMGATMLGTLFLGPFGILGNAALGAGIGLVSTTEVFKKIMLGAKGRDGIRRGGLAGAIQRHVTNPLKRNMKIWAKDFGKYLRNDIVKPISGAIKPIGLYLANGIKNGIGSLWDLISDKLAGPGSFFERQFNNIFFGAKKLGGGLTGLAKFFIGGGAKKIVHGIGGLGDILRGWNYEKGDTGGESAVEVLNNMKRMNYTNDRYYNIYSKIAELNSKDFNLTKNDAYMADLLSLVLGKEGKRAIRSRRSQAFGYLTSGINEQTLNNDRLEDHHSDLLKIADQMRELKSSAEIDRVLTELEDKLHEWKIVGKDYDDLMKLFTKEAVELRTAMAAEQMRISGLSASHQEAFQYLKKMFGSDLSDKDFRELLPTVAKALKSEVRVHDKFVEDSIKEQEQNGNVANTSLISGKETGETLAIRRYQGQVITGLEITNRLLASMAGWSPDMIDRIFHFNANGELDLLRFRTIANEAQAVVDYHNRRNSRERGQEDFDLKSKALALNADKTIGDFNLEDFRSVVATNNRQYTSTLIKLGKAKDKGNDAIIKSFKKILEIDRTRTGKLFERIAQLTMAGLTVPEEQYAIINDLPETGFNCALELIKLGCTIGDFSTFADIEDDAQGRDDAELMIQIANTEFSIQDETGKYKRGSKIFENAEVLKRHLRTKEGLTARHVGGNKAFIENELLKNYLLYHNKYKANRHEVGLAMKREGNALSNEELDNINRIDKESSEVSQVTGEHQGLVGLGQRGVRLARKGINTLINTERDLLSTTGNIITGTWGTEGKQLGRQLTNGLTLARIGLTDKEFIWNRGKTIAFDQGQKLFFKFADAAKEFLGDQAELTLRDAIKHPSHIPLYWGLFRRIKNGWFGFSDYQAIGQILEDIRNGYSPFELSDEDYQGLPSEEVIKKFDGKGKTGVGDDLMLSHGTPYVGSKKSFAQYAAGSFFTNAKNAALGYFMGSSNKDNKEDKKEEEPQVSSENVNSIVDSLKKFSAAATSAFSFHEAIDDNKSQYTGGGEINLGDDGRTVVSTPHGIMEYVKSSVDGQIMAAHTKENSETLAAKAKDEERKEKIANAIEEMATNIKGGLGDFAGGLKKRASGSLLDLFRSVTSLPGEILGGMASALFAIPIIGGIAKGILSPIASLFGKFKDAIFGAGAKTARSIGPVASNGIKAAGSALIRAVPLPIKLLLGALLSFFGASAVFGDNKAEAATIGSEMGEDLNNLTGGSNNIEYEVNPDGTISPTNYASTRPDDSFFQWRSKLGSAADFIRGNALTLGGGTLATGLLLRSLNDRSRRTTAVTNLQQRSANLRAKAGLTNAEKKTLERIERQLAVHQRSIGQSTLKGPLAFIEKHLPNPITLVRRNPYMTAALLAGLGITGYGAKSVYDSSNFGRYGNSQKEIEEALGMEGGHEFNAEKNGLGALSFQYQNLADSYIKNGWTEEQVTKQLKFLESRGEPIYAGHRTANDERIDTAKDLVSTLGEKAVNIPWALTKSNLYDFTVRGLTGLQLGSARHSLVSGTVKTLGDIVVGDKELNEDTLKDLGYNIGITHGSNVFSNRLFNWSNASTHREVQELKNIMTSYASNKELQAILESRTADIKAQLAKATNPIERKILEDRLLVAQQNAIKEFATTGNRNLLTPISKTARGISAIAKVPLAMRSLGEKLISTTHGKALTVGALGAYIYSHATNTFASPEEKARKERERNEKEAEEKARIRNRENRINQLPKLENGQRIEKLEDGRLVLLTAEGLIEKVLTPQEADLYAERILLEKERDNDNNILSQVSSEINKSTGTDLMDRSSLGSLIGISAGMGILKRNRIAGGFVGSLIGKKLAGEELTYDSLQDALVDTLGLGLVRKGFEYAYTGFKDRSVKSIGRAIKQDVSDVFSTKYHKENINNLRRNWLLRRIPGFGLNDEITVIQDAQEKMLKNYDAKADMKNFMKKIELKEDLERSFEELRRQGVSEEEIKNSKSYKTYERLKAEIEEDVRSRGGETKSPTEAQNEEIQKQVEEATKKITETESKVKITESELTKLNNDLKVAKEYELNLTDEADKKSAHEETRRIREEYNVKLKEIEDLKKQVENERTKVEDQNKKIQDQVKEAVEKSNENVSKIQDDTEKKIKDVEDKIKSLEADKKEYESRIRTLESENAQNSEKYAKTERTLKGIENELKAKISEVEELKRQQTKTTTENITRTEEQPKTETIRREFSPTYDTINEYEKALADKDWEVKDLDRKIDNIKNDIRRADRDSNQYKRYTQELENLNQQKEKLVNEKTELETKLTEAIKKNVITTPSIRQQQLRLLDSYSELNAKIAQAASYQQKITDKIFELNQKTTENHGDAIKLLESQQRGYDRIILQAEKDRRIIDDRMRKLGLETNNFERQIRSHQTNIRQLMSEYYRIRNGELSVYSDPSFRKEEALSKINRAITDQQTKMGLIEENIARMNGRTIARSPIEFRDSINITPTVTIEELEAQRKSLIETKMKLVSELVDKLDLKQKSPQDASRISELRVQIAEHDNLIRLNDIQIAKAQRRVQPPSQTETITEEIREEVKEAKKRTDAHGRRSRSLRRALRLSIPRETITSTPIQDMFRAAQEQANINRINETTPSRWQRFSEAARSKSGLAIGLGMMILPSQLHDWLSKEPREILKSNPLPEGYVIIGDESGTPIIVNADTMEPAEDQKLVSIIFRNGRRLPPNSMILVNDKKEPVIVNRNGEVLEDQSALSEEPIISPGTHVEYDESTGKKVQVDDKTGQALEDQTQVQEKESTVSDKAMIGLAATSGASLVTGSFKSTRFINEWFGNQSAKLASRFGIAANPLEGGRVRQVSNTLLDLSKQIKDVGVLKTFQQKGAGIAKQATEAATKALENNVMAETVLTKTKELLEKFYGIVGKYVSPEMMNSIKGFGTKLLQLLLKPAFMQKFIAFLLKQAGNIGAGVASAGIGTIVLTAAFAITSFFSGWNHAEEMLEIPNGKATIGMKVFCATLSALTAIPMVGIIIFLLNETGTSVKALLSMGVTDLFGFDEETLRSLRKEDENFEEEEGYSSFEEAQEAWSHENFMTWVKKSTKGVMSAVMSSASSTAALISDRASKAVQGISDLANDTKIYIQEKSTGLTKQISEWAKSGYESLKSKASSAWQTATEYGSKAVNAGKEILGKVGNFFMGLVPDVETLKHGKNDLTGKGKSLLPSLGTGYVQQTDPDVANIKLSAPGDTYSMYGADRGCQATALTNAERYLGYKSNHVANMKASMGKGKNYYTANDGSMPEYSQDIARSHNLQASNVDTMTGLRTLASNPNTSAVVQLDGGMMSPYSREEMGLGPDDAHYVTLTGRGTWIDPADSSGIGIERPITPDMYSAMSNMTVIKGRGNKLVFRNRNGKEVKDQSLTRKDTISMKQKYGRGFVSAEKMWALANWVAQRTNIDPRYLYGQWYHESGAFDSPLVRSNYNFGGVTQAEPNDTPQPDGNCYYIKFDSPEDYAEYFATYINHPDWPQGFGGSTSPEDYAHRLKIGGYYGDDESNYIAGIKNGMQFIPSTMGEIDQSKFKGRKLNPARGGSSINIATTTSQTVANQVSDASSTPNLGASVLRIVSSIIANIMAGKRSIIPFDDSGINRTLSTNNNNFSNIINTTNALPTDTTVDPNDIGSKIVATAKEMVDKVPYIYGGEGPNGVDCSGLVSYIYKKVGLNNIPRMADDQYNAFKAVNAAHNGTLQGARPGDAVFSTGSDPGANGVGHVGLYIGDNQMIEAQQSGTNVLVSDARRKLVGYGDVRSYAKQSSPTGKGKLGLGSFGRNRMSTVAQEGVDCTLHATKNMYRAYKNEEVDPSFTTWASMMDNLPSKEMNFYDRASFESAVESHFNAKPENPIFLYQVNGDGGGVPKTNAFSGTHATVIGRKTKDNRYEIYDSAGGRVYTLALSEIYDDSAKGGTQSMPAGAGNNLWIPTIDPSSKITEWVQSGEESASPGSGSATTGNNATTNTNGTQQQTQSKDGGWMGWWDQFLKFLNIYDNGPAPTGFNTNSTTTSNNTATTYSKNVEELQAKIWNHLEPKYGPTVAAAIMGNMDAESSFNPADMNDIGASGLCQWYDVRERALKDYASSKGKPWEDPDIQLEYLDKEIAESYTDLIQQMKNMSVEDAAIKWENVFEISGDTASFPRRTSTAREMYNKFVKSGKGKSQNEYKRNPDSLLGLNDMMKYQSKYLFNNYKGVRKQGTGKKGRFGRAVREIPTFTYSGNWSGRDYKDQLNSNTVKNQSNKDEETQRVWDYLCSAHGPVIASVLMANYNSNVYGHPNFRIPMFRKAEYEQYLRKFHLEPNADSQMRYLSRLISVSDQPTINTMKNSNVATATEIWYNYYDPNADITARQESAKRIYSTYTNVDQAQSTAGMERDAVQHSNSDMLGDANQETVEKVLNGETPSEATGENNGTPTPPTTTSSNSGGLLGSIMNSVGGFFSGAKSMFSSFASTVGSFVMNSPIGTMLKTLFGDNAVSRFSLFGGLNSPSNSSTSSSNPTSVGANGAGLSNVTGEGFPTTNQQPLEDPQYITIHNTGGSDTPMSVEEANKIDPSAAEIHRMHLPGGGTELTSGIAYHFVIRRNGTIERGRREDLLGTHTWKHNHHNLGIVLSGHFDFGTPSVEQLASCAHLVADLCKKYNIPITRDHIVGHREFYNDNGATTSCPGKNLFDKLDSIVETAAQLAKEQEKSEETIDITAPNGKKIDKNDWDYLKKRGFSDEKCKEILFAHEKYRKEEPKNNVSSITPNNTGYTSPQTIGQDVNRAIANTKKNKEVVDPFKNAVNQVSNGQTIGQAAASRAVEEAKENAEYGMGKKPKARPYRDPMGRGSEFAVREDLENTKHMDPITFPSEISNKANSFWHSINNEKKVYGKDGFFSGIFDSLKSTGSNILNTIKITGQNLLGNLIPGLFNIPQQQEETEVESKPNTSSLNNTNDIFHIGGLDLSKIGTSILPGVNGRTFNLGGLLGFGKSSINNKVCQGPLCFGKSLPKFTHRPLRKDDHFGKANEQILKGVERNSTQVHEARTMTIENNQQIENSLKIRRSEQTPNSSINPITNNTNNEREKQLETLIEEQQKTNTLLAQLLAAFISGGKSLEDTIMNSMPKLLAGKGNSNNHPTNNYISSNSNSVSSQALIDAMESRDILDGYARSKQGAGPLGRQNNGSYSSILGTLDMISSRNR